MEKKNGGKSGKSKKLVLLIPDILLCLLSWAVIYVWFQGNLWFWGLLIAFLLLTAAIVVSGIKKKRSGNPKWASGVFVWLFLLFLVPTIYMITTVIWAVFEMLPQ